MPRKYLRNHKVVRGQWTEENLILAMDKVKKGEISKNEAQRRYGVPIRTLSRRLMTGNTTKSALGPQASLGTDNEKRLASYIKRLSSAGFAPDRSTIRSLAYQFAEKHGIKHKFSKENEKAGQHWLTSFLERNKDISVRQAEGLSVERAQGMSREEDTQMKQEEEENADPLEYQPEIEENDQCVETPQNDDTIKDESMEPELYEVETLSPSQAPNHGNNDNKEITSNYGTVEATVSRNKHQDFQNPDTGHRRTDLQDRHDVFGKNVAMKLRHISSISNTQRLMAEKVINDALYMAEMGLLTVEHCNVLK